MRNAGLDEAQTGIKIARRNINNLRHSDDTTLMAESEEELKGLLIKLKEESEKAGLKFSTQKTNITASSVQSHQSHQFSSVQFSRSVLSDSLRPHESQHARPPCPSQTPRVYSFMSIEVVMPSSHLILSSPSPPAPNPSQHQGLFQNESTLHMRCRFSISPSNEHPGLISFRMDWLDLLAVQGTLKSLLQHRSSKASIFQCSAFFTVQLSHPHMTTGKT